MKYNYTSAVENYEVCGVQKQASNDYYLYTEVGRLPQFPDKKLQSNIPVEIVKYLDKILHKYGELDGYLVYPHFVDEGKLIYTIHQSEPKNGYRITVEKI